jgi:hypothetical protein
MQRIARFWAWLRILLSVCSILALTLATAAADATISLTFKYRVHRFEPRGDWTTAGFSASLRLTETGGTETDLKVQGASEKRRARLGVTGSDTETVYRVVDENTILATRQFASHVAVVTIYVLEKSCSASLLFHLKPNYEVFLLPTQGLGREQRFRAIDEIKSTCTIK